MSWICFSEVNPEMFFFAKVEAYYLFPLAKFLKKCYKICKDLLLLYLPSYRIFGNCVNLFFRLYHYYLKNCVVRTKSFYHTLNMKIYTEDRICP
jgi:hypothetical protein